MDDNSGFIKAPQDPQLYFDLSEVMDDAKLALSEKVEFTLAVVRALFGYYNIRLMQIIFCPSFAAQR